MKINGVDVSRLVTDLTWSGDKSQAARKLVVELIQDDRDERLPQIDFDNNYSIETAFFAGNIYEIERDRAKSTVKLTCFDELFRLNRNKVTKKYAEATAEEIGREMCSLMGIEAGEMAETGEKVTFIANNKTYYQIIMMGYGEAHKKNERQYQCVMDGRKLNVVEKGSLCGVELDSAKNMTESIYRESIAELVNKVIITDSEGNQIGEAIEDIESQEKYGRYQVLYKEQKDKNTAEEGKNLLKKPKREGYVTALGDIRAKAGYSLIIKDALFKGQFWIETDTHHFKDGYHEMRLKLEFENKMAEEK